MIEIKKVLQDISNEGITRRIDELGRIVIPIIFRKENWHKDTIGYLQINDDYLVLSGKKEGQIVDEVKVDELGRITIQYELREQLKWKMKDYITMWNYHGYIIFKKLEEKYLS